MATRHTHIKYGIAVCTFAIFFSLGQYFTKTMYSDGLWFPSLAVYVIGTFLNARAYVRAHDGFVSYREVLISGIKMTAVISVMSIAFFFFSYFFMPGVKEAQLEHHRSILAKKISDPVQLEKEMRHMTGKWSYYVFIFGMAETLVIGVVLAAISAALTKRKRYTPIVADNF